MGSWKQWSARVLGSWGVYHIRDDQLGTATSAFLAPGFGIGISMLHPFGKTMAAGLQVLDHEILDDRQDRYISANVILVWNAKSGDSQQPRKATP
jgi:hypothetical protein